MRTVILTRELLDRGFDSSELARMSRAGDLASIRRGAYTANGLPASDPLERHRQLVEACVRRSAPESVASHVSAAVLHGLPVWTAQLGRVHLTRDRLGGGRTRRYTVVHGHPLLPGEVCNVDGFRVTTLARTVLDLGCTLPTEEAVSAGDASLRQGLDPGELLDQLQRARGRAGIGGARRAIGLLDARSESPGESFSRVVFARHGVPPPEPQFIVLGPDGTFIGRSDFAWPERYTLGEFDGRKKYGGLADSTLSPQDAVFAEKLREDALRDQGWQVVRWVWADLYEPARLLDRLNRAFARGAAGR